MVSAFQDIAHITILPLTPMLKLKKMADCQETHSLYFPMVANALITFGWHRMQIAGVVFWNFQPQMVLF